MNDSKGSDSPPYQGVEKRDLLSRLWRDFIFRHCGVRVARLIPQDSPRRKRGLHLIVLHQPARNTVVNGLRNSTGLVSRGSL